MAALSLCEGLHDLQDQIKTLQELDRRTNYIETESKNLADHVETFKVKLTYLDMDILTDFLHQSNKILICVFTIITG